MRILFASSEARSLIKTGGLADVSADLPTALSELGHEVRLVLPAYLDSKAKHAWKKLGTLALPPPFPPVEVLEGILPDSQVSVWLIDAPLYFDRAGNPYLSPDGHEWPDNHLRFGLFGQAIADLALGGAPTHWRPDILHCNDWQTGLAPALLSDRPHRPGCVFTIHNLAYQGLFPRSAFDELELPHHLWNPEALEFYGQLSFIKGGIAFADRLTTVSPTYAREILTPEQGGGLEGLLAKRANVLTGILNGIDTHLWDPRHDRFIAHLYDPTDRAAKAVNTSALRTALGLENIASLPLLAHIGRLVEQKGIDLILTALEPLLAAGRAQAVILGSGEKRFEQGLEKLAMRYPRMIATRIGYDEALAHRIEASADAFLMPSRFEPCGLNQMYSLRYGTVPIVRRTGGLADTVIDASPEALLEGKANGFVFDEISSAALSVAIERALDAWHKPDLWAALVAAGSACECDWRTRAREYVELYRRML